MIINFELYNESLRDKMKGKSESDVYQILVKSTDDYIHVLDKTIQYDMVDGFKSTLILLDSLDKIITEEEQIKIIRNIVESDAEYILKYILDNNVFDVLNKEKNITDFILPHASFHDYIGIVKIILNHKLFNDYSFSLSQSYANIQVNKEIIKLLKDYQKNEKIKNPKVRKGDLNDLNDEKNENMCVARCVSFETYNESLRDKMKGKTREEILNSLSIKGKSDEEIFVFACTYGEMWLVKDMIEQGVDPSQDNMYGVYRAIRYGHLKLAEFLLNKEEVINAMGEDFADEILDKMVGKSDKIVEFILDNPTIKKYIQPEYIEEIEEYLEKDLNESLKDKLKGKSDDEIKRMIINNRPLDIFYKSIKFNYMEGLKMSILLFDDNSSTSELLSSGLDIASGYGHVNIVKELLKDDRVDPSDFNNSAIKNASHGGYLEIVKLLLKDKRFRYLDSDYNTTLKYAIDGGYEDIVDFLKKHKPTILNESLRDKIKGKSNDEIEKAIYGLSGKELLDMSVKYNYLDGVQSVLDKNKEGTFPRVNGSKVLQLATSKNYRDYIDNLDKINALQIATTNNYKDIVKLLIKDTKINKNNKDVLLRLSALNGNEELIELYIEYGASPSDVYKVFIEDDSKVDFPEEQQKINRAKELLKKYL